MDGIFHQVQRREQEAVSGRGGAGSLWPEPRLSGFLPSPLPYPGSWLTGRLLLATQTKCSGDVKLDLGVFTPPGMGKQHGSGYPRPSC